LQCARALRGATPLLATSSEVRVLAVRGGKSDEFPPTDPLRYLASHHIKAELTELAKGKSVEETIAAEVARLKAQLLVMGAYSHTRLREFVFGGVTRHFLKQAEGPALLLAH
jgi:nucleotide-binding universal stress UspA family protein